MRAVKNCSAGVRCGNYGHWYADHNQHGSLRHDMESYPDLIVKAVNGAVAASRRQNRPAVAAPAATAPVKTNDETIIKFMILQIQDETSGLESRVFGNKEMVLED